MAAHPDLRAHELPMIGGLYRLARPFIDGGMAAAIADPVVRDRTLTVYTDVRRVMAALQIPSTATMTLLLVDRSGRIFWRDAGAYDVERAAGLERAAPHHGAHGEVHMSWLNPVKGDSLGWLLEPDAANPGVRYFALRDLLERPADAAEVVAAQAAVMRSGPVPTILDAQHPDGYWHKPGGGYGKYRGTAWQIIFLGELGADPDDERVQRGCEYLLNHTIAANGGFACSNTTPVPSSVVHCLNGNLLASLIRLGRLDDPRVQQALAWQACAITGEEPIRYYQSGTSGPAFACAANAGQPCAWGATKAMKALLAVPPAQRTSLIQQAIAQGAQLLLQYNLASADYPFTGKISSAWFKLGFPLSYWSDVLETLSVLVALGYGHDPRLAEPYQWLMSKQSQQGRWKLENTVNGKLWVDIERRGKPSKWLTLRVLRVVKAIEAATIRL